MEDNYKYIRIGFFSNFKDYDSLLISTDTGGLLEMESVFIQLSKGLAQFDFADLQYLDPKYAVDVQAYTNTCNDGLIKTGNRRFEWTLTGEKWLEFSRMLRALYEHHKTGCGHQYLDFETNFSSNEKDCIGCESLQVVFSLNEYPLSFWEEHFERCNL